MAARPPDLTSRLARAWFPTALLVLLLLAVPGVVLFALNLLGREGPVNGWLQEHFGLTYHIPVPWWAGLLLLLVPVAVLLLYFLKLKRKPLQVPSTFLWRKSIEDLHVNSLFQWLRENVLLLLQLLAVLALLYALMAFRLHADTSEARHYILMIDNSASMAATDVAPSRLQQAKDQALQVIESHSDSDVGMVIVFNASAEIRQSYTADRGLLKQAVNGVLQTQRPTRIEEALALANSLANPTRSTENEAARPPNEEPGKERTYVTAEGIPTEVHLFSDGRFGEAADFALGNLNVNFHAVGAPGAEAVDNVGIVTLNALRDELDPARLQALVRVLNFGPAEVLAKLQVEVHVGGALTGIHEKEIQIPRRQVVRAEGEEQQARTSDSPGEGVAMFELLDLPDHLDVVLVARLHKTYRLGPGAAGADESNAFRDQFPLDDQAWLVIGVVRKARVLIVGPPNKILSDFFDQEATRRVAAVTYLAPEQLEDEEAYRRPALDGAYDLVVFDRCSPAREADLPLANTFFIDALPPPWKKEEMPKVENPHIRGWMSKHPLLEYLTGLQDIGIAEAFRFDLNDPRVPPRTPRLLETDRDAAVLFTLARQSFTDLVMTFPLITLKDEWNTNWWRQVSFPLFLRNVLYVLGNVSEGTDEEIVRPGQVKTLRPAAAVRRLEVIAPSGQAEVVERGSRAEFAFGETDELGVYRVRAGDEVLRSFAVNLLDAEESNLQPRGEITIGSERIAAGEKRSRPRETWKWVVVAALGLLLLEWYIYNRRVYI